MKNLFSLLFLGIILLFSGCQGKAGGYTILLKSTDTIEQIRVRYYTSKKESETETALTPYYKFVGLSLTSVNNYKNIINIEVCRKNNTGIIRGCFDEGEIIDMNGLKLYPENIFYLEIYDTVPPTVSSDSLLNWLKAINHPKYFEMQPNETCKSFYSK